MWCDNCLLFFPLRAGAVALAVFMALYQFAGGFILFKLGTLLFFHPPDATVYFGFALFQGVLAVIAAISISNRSYFFTKLVLYLYPLVLLLAIARGALMSWELQHWEYRIVGECQHEGHQWLNDTYTNPDGSVVATYSYDTNNATLPSVVCNGLGVHNFIELIIACVVLDFVLMLYFTFLAWRFLVKLQHYPVQKGLVADGSYYT